MLVNTSFNVRGEPIVCTPEDAFRCFMGTDIEVLAIGNCFLRKQDQDPELKEKYEDSRKIGEAEYRRCFCFGLGPRKRWFLVGDRGEVPGGGGGRGGRV